MKHKAYIAFFCICLCAGILVFAVAAQAQGKLKMANAEDVAIAFYKTGKIVPNFSKWIKNREPYIHTPWALRDEVYKKELLRLKSLYQNFDIVEDYLTVKTKTNIRLSRDKRREGGYQYFLNARLVASPEVIYFPYRFLKEYIALMPYTIEKFMRLEITRGDYDYIRRNQLIRKSSTAVFYMRADEADIAHPYEIDEQAQWVLKTKIVAVEFWSNDGRLIFEYSRPNFVTSSTMNLQELYKKNALNENAIMIEKNVTVPKLKSLKLKE